MIDESILNELTVVGSIGGARVQFSAGARKGILELVHFYRRMSVRRLGDLLRVEDASLELLDAVAEARLVGKAGGRFASAVAALEAALASDGMSHAEADKAVEEFRGAADGDPDAD